MQRGIGGVLAAVCAVGCALAAHALGVSGSARSLPPPERQTLLAAMAFEHGGHLPGAVTAAAAQPGHQHVTVVATVGKRVERTTAVVASSPSPAPAQTFVQQNPADTLTPAGEATAFGCAPALAYLAAYAAPGFTFDCPADAGGHQAGTLCITSVGAAAPCDLARIIHIAEPCAAAYMNEASNSWVLVGKSDAPIDPYGSCR